MRYVRFYIEKWENGIKLNNAEIILETDLSYNEIERFIDFSYRKKQDNERLSYLLSTGHFKLVEPTLKTFILNESMNYLNALREKALHENL